MGLLLGTGLMLAGCDRVDRFSDPAEWTARDSAGVRVVENRGAPSAAWRVEADPIFSVGWEEGGPLFTWPQSGRILPDGGALVGEFGEGVVYRLGPDGSVVDAWGRKGEGPGEYQALDAILLKGDSVLVTDGRLRRLTVVGPEGEVRTQRLPGTFLHRASALWPDERLLLIPGAGYSSVSETRPAWVFETQPILAWDLPESTVDTLARLPHLRRWYGTDAGSPGAIQVKGRAGGFSGGFVWARSDIPEVRWFDPEGRLVQVARWDEEAAPLSPEWRDSMKQRYRDIYTSRGVDDAFLTSQLARLEEDLDRHEGPLPYWNDLHIDRVGNAWLSRYNLPGSAPGAWRVVDLDGELQGWVDLPGVFTILDATHDRVLAVAQNELDVPAVLMFRLAKP